MLVATGLRRARAVFTVRVLIWVVPFAAYALPRAFPLRLHDMVAALAGLGVVVLVARRPSSALVVLVGLTVFDEIGRAGLYRFGVPAEVVQALGSWNEVVLVGLVAAALHHALLHPAHLDRLDRLALALLVVLAVYLLVPGPFVFEEVRPLDARLQSFRSHSMVPLAFLASRHIPLSPGTHLRAMRAIALTGLVLGTQVAIEFAFSAGWNTFVLDHLRLHEFRFELTGVGLPNPFDIRTYDSTGGRAFVRVGSVAFDPIRIAFFFVIPLGIALQLSIRRAVRPWVLAASLLSGAAIVLTFTRSAVLAGAITILATLAVRRGSTSGARARVALVLVAVIALSSPSLVSSGLGERSRGAFEGTDRSTDDHLERTADGLRTLVESPLGKGLATGPSVNRLHGFAVGPQGNDVNPENSYLLVGNEIGVLPMVLFTWFMLATVRRLRPPPDAGDDRAVLQAGLRATLLGLLVGGLLLQVWIDVYTAVAFWGLAGLALNATSTPPGADLPSVVTAQARGSS